jgi:CheY-like chemotaxis protein
VRVVVVHYEAAEAASLAARLRREGFDAEAYPHVGPKGFRELRAHPPDAILIDLMRMPSYGRAMGALLREQKSTRSIPLVFLEGEPEKTALAKQLLPDAGFAKLPRIGAALRRAVERPPGAPVVPDSSAVPFAKKLRLRDGASVGLIGAPEGFTIEGVAAQRGRRDAGVVLVFVKTRAALARELRSFATINEACAPLGLVGYKACAVDATWSAVAVSRRATAAGRRRT